MAMINYPDQIPIIGDSVKNLEYSKDKEVVWITFQSGRVVCAHVNRRTREEHEAELMTCDSIGGDSGLFQPMINRN